MSIYPLPRRKKYRKVILFIFILSAASFVSAREPRQDISPNRGYIKSGEIPEKKRGTVILPCSGRSSQNTRRGEPAPDLSWQEEKNLSQLQKQARLYRSQGRELQRIGNLEQALSLYQKAIELDPAYAFAYNDLGIIYEASGSIERAEESYLKSITMNPRYLSAYSNLALLYENKRDLDKAAFYWEKRAELGSPDDPWTEKAKQRLADIRLVLEKKVDLSSREQEVIGFVKELSNKKSVVKQYNKKSPKPKKQNKKNSINEHFEQAKQSYEQEDYATAIKEALDAQQLDPDNKDIEAFIDKVQLRALSE